MKIIFNTYPVAFQCPGGGEIQLLKSKQALEELGHEVIFFDPWSTKLEDADVVHHFSVQGGSTNFCGFAHNNNIPLVVSPILWLPDDTSNYPMGEIAHLFEIADVICPNSETEIDNLLRSFNTHPDKFIATHNGIDEIFCRSEPEHLFRDKFNIQSKFILCVANIEKRKNQHLLMEAAEKLQLQLILIGHIRDAQYFDQLNISEKQYTQYIGPLDHHSPLLRSAYAACEAFALPSTLETPGLAALEAAAAGAKLIITKEGSTEEYFGSSAEYTTPNAIDSIIAGIKNALKTPRKTSTIFKRYNWNNTAKQLETAYIKAMESKANHNNRNTLNLNLKITIGIVIFNNPIELIERLINSLEHAVKNSRLDYKNFSLAFINTGIDTPVSSSKIKTYHLPTQGNIGYTSASNIILRHAFETHDNDLVITANPDGMFFYDTIEELLSFYTKNPHCLIEASQFPEEHPKTYNPINHTTDWASGCCLLYSKDIINKIGYHDEAFFLYMEDVDFSWRARYNNITIKTCPSAKYAHDVIARPEPSKKIKEYFYIAGREFAAKWNNKAFQEHCELQLSNEGIFRLPEETSTPRSLIQQLFSNSTTSITLDNKIAPLPKIIDWILKYQEGINAAELTEKELIKRLFSLYLDGLHLLNINNYWSLNCPLNTLLKQKNSTQPELCNLLAIYLQQNPEAAPTTDFEDRTKATLQWWSKKLSETNNSVDIFDTCCAELITTTEAHLNTKSSENNSTAHTFNAKAISFEGLPTILKNTYNQRPDLQEHFQKETKEGLEKLILWWLRWGLENQHNLPAMPPLHYRTPTYNDDKSHRISNFNQSFRFSDSRW